MSDEKPIVKPCKTGRCAYGTECVCDFYADWPRERPTTRPWMGRNATLFSFGHRTGRSDCARRLWPHLTPEGRELATVIATEGDDDQP